jgi:hypothetical protein
MNMKKKSKKVKKYAVGGDLRMSEEGMDANPGFDGSPLSLSPIPGGGGDDGSATGQVKAISKAAGRAGDYLSTAGKAIGSGDRYPAPMKTGGKVKRYDKGKKVKLDTTQYDNQNMMEFDGITVPEGATEEDSKSKKKEKKKPVKKPVRKNMGGMMKYKKGGKVTQPRGAGIAERGVRRATMVRMKGS